jgi:alpha-L-fucosidase
MLEEVSRDGSYAVNIPIAPDGSIDEAARTMLVEMGAWMKVNGEAIYGSHAWLKYGEGPIGPNGKIAGLPTGALDKAQAQFRFGPGDFRFTQGKDGAVYAFALEAPKPGEILEIVSMGKQAGLLKGPVKEVTLLGTSQKLRWVQKDDALEIHYPSQVTLESKDMAVVFRVR